MDRARERLHEARTSRAAIVERRRRHPQNVGSPQVREDVRLLEPREDALDGPIIEFDRQLRASSGRVPRRRDF